MCWSTASFRGYRFTGAPASSYTSIDGHWKLVVHKVRPQDVASGLWDFSTSEWELYDLSKDRTEINNLADSHPEKLTELRDKYDTWWTEVEPGIVRADE